MAHVFVMDFAGGSAADYDWVVERMGLGGRLPPGALAHAAMPTEDGWRVTDVWEDPGTFQRFAAEQIGPLSQERGMAAPAITDFPAQRWERVTSEHATFVQVVRLPGLAFDAFDEHDREIRPDGTFPLGLIWHAAGAVDGDTMVVDAWADRALRDEFIEGRVMPVMQNAPSSGPPSFSEYEVHATLE